MTSIGVDLEKKQEIEGDSSDSSNGKNSGSDKSSETYVDDLAKKMPKVGDELPDLEEAYDDSSDSDTMPEVVYGEGGECDEDADSCDDLTEEQERIYDKWLRKTDGFSVPRFLPIVSHCCLITPIPQDELASDKDQFLPWCAQSAIDNNYKETGQPLKLVRIIKCNESFSGSYMNFYITFEAEDESKGQKQTYETYVQVPAARGSSCEVKIFREKKQRRRQGNSLKSRGSMVTKVDAYN